MKKIRKVMLWLFTVIFMHSTLLVTWGAELQTPIGEIVSNSMGKVIDTEKTNRYIVKYKNAPQVKGLTRSLKGENESTKKVASGKIEVITTKTKMSPKEVIENLPAHLVKEDIEYIQPDYPLTLTSVDPYYNSQWGIYSPAEQSSTVQETVYSESTVQGSVYEDVYAINTTGHPITFRIDANVVPAWQETQGEGITVAVIDTGIDITHEDLIENIWQNNKEIPGNGIDDDGNGYIDDANGWNFYDDNKEVHNEQIFKDEWHGTHIAGIIAASKDNHKGITGVAPKAKIMPLKVFENGTAYTSDIIKAIEYAQKMGAQIVNCSWGGNDYNPALEEAMKKSSLFFVCAAGNNGTNIDETPVYPAAFNQENIITVGSTNSKGYLSPYSNYGEKFVNVGAPGEDIISTVPRNAYEYKSGTSMATGYVSGEAALLLAYQKDIQISKIKERIINSSDHYSSLVNKINKGSTINCGNMIQGISSEGVIQIDSSTLYGQNSIGVDSGLTTFSATDGYSEPITSTGSIIGLPEGAVEGQINMRLKGVTRTNQYDFDKQQAFLGVIDSVLEYGFQYDFTAAPSLIGIKKKFKAGNVTVSFDCNIPTSKCLTVIFRKTSYLDTSDQLTYQFGSGINSHTFNLVNGDYNYLIFARANADTAFNASVDNILVEYTPERRSFISEIKSTSSVRLKSIGKNKFDISRKDYTALGTVLNKPTVSDVITFKSGSEQRYAIQYKVKPNTKYSLSYEGNQVFAQLSKHSKKENLPSEFAKYRTGYIATSTSKSTSVQTDADTQYLMVYFSNYNDTTIEKRISNIMLNEGDITTFEQQKQSVQYIILPTDENRNIIDMNSLPNSTYDEVSDGKLKKRIWKDILDGTGSWGLSGTLTNTYRFYLTISDMSESGDTEVNASLDGFDYIGLFSSDSEHIMTNSAKNLFMFIDKTKIDSLSGATVTDKFKTWLSMNQPSFIYQLAKPKIYDMNLSPLTAYEDGTIYIEPVVKDSSTYKATGIPISNPELPIQQIESVYKVSEGIKTEITDYQVKNNGQLLVIPNAKPGELYEYTYYYDSSLTTIPTITFSVPQNQTAQIDGITDTIQMLLREIELLKSKQQAFEENRLIEYEYDENGRLLRRMKY